MLLFVAQWFPRYSKCKLMKWTRNTRYNAFMDVFHAPFTRKHHYWLGLFLFALIVNNMIASLASSIFLPVFSMGGTALGLIILKLLNKHVYKHYICDILETAFLVNLITLSYGTLFAKIAGTKSAISILANVSMSISACLFVIIISYHSYKYVYLQSNFYRRHKLPIKKITTTIKEKLRRGPKRSDNEELVTDQGGTLETHYTAMRSHHQREPDLDVLAPITAEDYRPATPPNHKPQNTITYIYTVVETTET